MFEQSGVIDVAILCRDESCDVEGLHLVHEVEPKRESKPRSCRAPWLLPAPQALDDSIVRSVSDTQPKRFAALVDAVENDFGSLGMNRESGLRRLHRRIRALVDAGRILRIDLGNTLFAYLKPTSRIANDVSFIREAILDSLTEDSGRHIGDELAAV